MCWGSSDKKAYETGNRDAVVEATEKQRGFFPCKAGAVRVATRTVLTCCGRAAGAAAALRENPPAGQKLPVDDLLDVAHRCRWRCVRCAGGSGSTWPGLCGPRPTGTAAGQLSDELLRQIVESEGQAVLAWQEQEQLALDFDAGLHDPVHPDGQAKTRVYVGIDGFMPPMVTEGEASGAAGARCSA